ncbi:hypothetical protein BCM35_02965 [Helicobacter winghamensis]|uniref:hypothetical protein n=1 Tax=Helicobacter winghamensis TaxID=157268 RepID=UPI000C6C99EB|nr:hypothetical protein [Helicobacter winghamensis]PKT76900.1 hypothetical protein BCM34_06880 [Helicobacter winghamensis]PKT77040.1 hypothetical protein BCM35_02965 [Helicobacter winghamensis]
MQVGDKNNQMWGLLSQAYDQNKSSNLTGFTNKSDSNSVFSTKETQKTQGIDALFDTANTNTTTREIEDVLTLSHDFTKMRDFAKDFSINGNLSELGDAMMQNGILSKEEKMGFDVLYKFNPSLDSTQTQNILQNANLSKENLNLLSNVDRKISAVRYFGNF